MQARGLFEITDDMDLPSAGDEAGDAMQQGKPRFRQANRKQLRMLSTSLDELLADDHPVRTVWAYVSQLDVSPLIAEVRAVGSAPGRAATHPHVLIALWMMATLDGVGAGRRLAELCRTHIAYRWILGDLTINYHTLSDFRVEHEAYLDQLLTTGIAVLLQQGLVTLERVAEDGMRVRAAAGASSIHRQATLERHLEEARGQIEQLKAERDADPSAGARRQLAAKERAQRERAERLQQALAARDEVEQKQQRRGRGSEQKEARGSSTDPEARRMKMPDGGTRPALNTQLATDVDSRLIVGVIVTNQGTDNTGLQPMVEQIEERLGRRPGAMQVDGGFVNRQQIEALEAAGTKIYAPVRDAEKLRKQGKDPFARRRDDSPELAAWRERMGTAEAQQIYKERAATAEWVNAMFRNRGFYRISVRGLQKTRCLALWQALVHNLQESLKLIQQTAETKRQTAARLGRALAAGTLRPAPA